MIAVDTNIPVYAFRESNRFHQAALACTTRLAQGRKPWAVPWPCVHEFLATVTNPRIPPGPPPLAQALAAVEAWMASPTLTPLTESGAHRSELMALLMSGSVRGGLVHDARVAALCLQHGVREFWTADRDFSRCPALKVVNPLVPS